MKAQVGKIMLFTHILRSCASSTSSSKLCFELWCSLGGGGRSRWKQMTMVVFGSGASSALSSGARALVGGGDLGGSK